MSDEVQDLTEKVFVSIRGGVDQLVARIFSPLEARPRLTRWVLAGPITLIVTLAIMAGMTAWWPPGEAGFDQIGMPLILSPIIWVCVFVYALLEENLGRGCCVMLALSIGNGVLSKLG